VPSKKQEPFKGPSPASSGCRNPLPSHGTLAPSRESRALSQFLNRLLGCGSERAPMMMCSKSAVILFPARHSRSEGCYGVFGRHSRS